MNLWASRKAENVFYSYETVACPEGSLVRRAGMSITECFLVPSEGRGVEETITIGCKIKKKIPSDAAYILIQNQKLHVSFCSQPSSGCVRI